MVADVEDLLRLVAAVGAELADENRSERERSLARRALLRISRELAPFRVAPHVLSPFDRPMFEARQVHLGAGRNQLPGFLNLDMVGEQDVLWDARAGLPLADGTVELVFSEHFLEHIDREFAVVELLREVRRVLQPGGIVEIGVPDAEFVVRSVLSGDAEVGARLRARYAKRPGFDTSLYDRGFDLIGLVLHDSYASPDYAPHSWGYSRTSLQHLLEQTGFSRIERLVTPPSYSDPKRHDSSLYVRARKA